MRRTVAPRAALIALAVVTLLTAAPLPAGAHDTRYEQLQQQIRETRAKIDEARRRERDLMAALASSDRRRISLESTIGSLTDKLMIAAAQQRALDAQMSVLSAQLRQATQDLQEALAQLSDQKTQIEQHATGLYISGGQEYAGVVLGAADFRSLASGFAYSESILDTEIGALRAIETAKAEVEIGRAEVQRKQVALRRQQDLVADQARRINSLRQQQANVRGQVLAEIDYRQELLSKVRDQKEAYLQALRSQLAQSASIEAMLRGAQSGQTVIAGAGRGYFVWPTSGRITDGYGWRTHPIYGYRSFHAGIDIGAPEGQSVIAARSGEILSVGYMGAYGLVVIVDHGKKVATVYAHLSRVYVREGQWVSSRQRIAAVGSTGWSTGPHLHFEVRIDGQHVNPMRYL